jgi:hypothetical protein
VPVCWSSALFAYHAESAKTRQAGESFASVSLQIRAVQALEACRPSGQGVTTVGAQVVDNLWIIEVTERLEHVERT